MKAIQVCVQLFGAFRKYSAGPGLRFEVPPGTTVAELRAHLGDALRSLCPAFPDQGLLDVSVLADEDRILDDGQTLGLGGDEVSLAVLPPVCGG